MLRVNQFSGFGGKSPSAGGGAPAFTITWQSSGGVGYSASSPSSFNVAYPASIAAGDLLVMIVGQKPVFDATSGGTVTTPSGWTLQASLTDAGGFATPSGADSGNSHIYVYTKEAAGSESGNLSVSVASCSVCWGVMHRLSKSGGAWSVAAVTGQDTTQGNISITFGSNPGVQNGDYIVCGFVHATDGAGALAEFSSPALSQTGVTFGTVTEQEEATTSNGTDIGGCTWRASVTAGTGSAAPQLTSNCASNQIASGRGPAAFIRIRAA